MKKDESVFMFPDTNSSRAQIEFLNRKFKTQKVAIIGLGGTGSYILDLISKTPVKEIHLYDGDSFEVHNAFRAPGAAPAEAFSEEEPIKKVEYYFKVYSKMHKQVFPNAYNITEDNIGVLKGMDFVFISIDKNDSRVMITQALVSLGVTFIDVGLGVKMVEDHLIATMRVTVGSQLKNDHLQTSFGSEEVGNNEYSTNIQIADLNCMNAVLAVIKWKKITGFYQDLKQEHNIDYLLITNKLMNGDLTA